MAPALNKRFGWCMGKSSSCRLLNLTWISMVHLTFTLIFRFSGSNSRRTKQLPWGGKHWNLNSQKYFTQDVYTPNDHLILLSRISVQLVLSRILVSFLIAYVFRKASYSYAHTSADCIWLKPPLPVYHFSPPLFFMFYLFIVLIYLYIDFSWVSSLYTWVNMAPALNRMLMISKVWVLYYPFNICFF